MRLIHLSLAATSLLTIAVAGASAAPVQPAPRSCPNASGQPVRQPGKANALSLLESVTQLLTPRGKPVLDTSFATTIAINNQASAALRAQALKDAQITDENAFTLADGLGPTMGDAYRRKAFYRSSDDGRTLEIGEIGPAVGALIKTANTISGSDSAEGKCAFADGIEPYQGGRWVPPPGGTLDVLGQAYGAIHADEYGNPRPFQTAPIDAATGPHIETWNGVDFFGATTNSRVMLLGTDAADRTGSNLTENPSYPSGHTTFGYTEALLLAMMVPERYRALAYRASEYGHSRIVIGAHYPLDVIAGRTLATYDLAQELAGRPGYPKGLSRALAAAATELRTYLEANGCPRIAVCAREPIVRAENADVFVDGRTSGATPAKSYAFRLAYGLAPLGTPDVTPEAVPPEAAALIETRFPYLDTDQRREVLRTTEGPAGYFLDVDPATGAPLAQATNGASREAGAYSRLDLFAAGGGYRTFRDDVIVDQEVTAIKNADLSPFVDFARDDTWTNDIDGPGGLTKRGSGALTLAGACTYSGPTRIEDGLLDVDGSIRSRARVEAGGSLGGTGHLGDVTVAAGGTLAPGARDGGGALAVDGSLSLEQGSHLSLHGGASDAKLKVGGKVTLNGAELILREGGALKPGASLTLIEAQGGVSGTFAGVRALSPSLVPNLTYSAKAVYLTLDDAPTASGKASP